MNIKSLFTTAILFVTAISMLACSQQDPNDQANRNLFNTEAESMYLLGNEAPLEAEESVEFAFHGQRPFFLWVLDLTDEQKEQIQEIGEKYRPDMRGMCQRPGEYANWDSLKQAREEMHEAMFAEIYEILTEDQKTILAEIQAQLDAGQYPTIVIEKRIAHLTEKLGLSEDQQDQIADLMADYGAQILDLKNSSDDMLSVRQQSREIMQAYHAAFMALLTEEQQTAFKELRRELRKHHPRFGHRGPRGGH